MSNVRKGKINSNVSFLKRVSLGLKALLVSPKTLEEIEKAGLEEPVEILDAGQPLVNTGHLSEERPVYQPLSAASMPPETPLVQGPDSNIFVKAANAIAGFPTNKETPVQPETPMIVPPSSEMPSVSIENMGPVQIERPNPYDVPQPSKTADGGHRIPDSVEAAINTQIVSPQEQRREVIEPSLQTPQEFENPQFKQETDPYVNFNVKLEDMRSKINREHEEYKQELNRKFRETLEDLTKKAETLNQRINSIFDDMSRAIEDSRANDLTAVRNAVNNQFSQFVDEYSGDKYNVR